MPTSDDLSKTIQDLRGSSGAAKVAANIFIDHNNPCWNALRQAALKNPNYVDPENRARYMLAQLDNETGAIGLVLNHARTQVIERESGQRITHIPPHSFATQEQADLWLALNAQPRFRYLLMVAKSDYGELNGVDQDAVPDPKDLVALFTQYGYSVVVVDVPGVCEQRGGFEQVWPTSVIAGRTVSDLFTMGFFDGVPVKFTEEARALVLFPDGVVDAVDLLAYQLQSGVFPVQHLWNGYGGVPIIGLRGMTWKRIIQVLELA